MLCDFGRGEGEGEGISSSRKASSSIAPSGMSVFEVKPMRLPVVPGVAYPVPGWPGRRKNKQSECKAHVHDTASLCACCFEELEVSAEEGDGELDNMFDL
mmetsp:Transcript_15895/g.43005  ORF Transcript_15895/g.43005 Transcript_15895/m.43005 type:complete len:100 (+) Transcript_15895:131-430(+)